MNVELRGQCMRRGSPSWNKRVPMSKRKTVKWRKRPPSIDNAYPAASRALRVHCTHVPMAEDRRQIPVAGQRGEGWRHFCNQSGFLQRLTARVGRTLFQLLQVVLSGRQLSVHCQQSSRQFAIEMSRKDNTRGEKCMRHFTHRRHQGQTSSRTELREDLATWLPSPPTAQQRRRKGRCSSRALLSFWDKLRRCASSWVSVHRADAGTRLHQGSEVQ